MEQENNPNKAIRQRRTFRSLDKQEAKRVLEIYVRRSLRNSEKTKENEFEKENGSNKDQGLLSESSKCNEFANMKKSNMACGPKAEENEENQDWNIESLPPDVKDDMFKSRVDDANCFNAKKQSWFKTLMSRLFKRKENKEDMPIRNVDKTVLEVSCPTEDQVTSSKENGPHTSKKFTRKTSLKRVLNFTKGTSEQGKVITPTKEECNFKLKRPTRLSLKGINRPLTGKTGRDFPKNCITMFITYSIKKNDECYQKLSAEIEHIVKECDDPHERSGAHVSQNTDECDALIKAIVSILCKKGDELNSKMKNDPTLNSFLKNISYNSFKQLADVYIDQEMKNKDISAMPDDMKFAYSIHFTAQVAGIAFHPVNRIMGFGNQYLQDTFFDFSRCKADKVNSTDSEKCTLSPD
ncbi:uncharacterized protein LOC128473637 [Spea bombifrons]|uniref:uncharacterized protein LOC128473637 n=1 Tax=Spea bombifrons TaxID=233779 RepID=UPI002349FC7C|nr:uncharacterized protein LOC128473637 [Spea bombifrons]